MLEDDTLLHLMKNRFSILFILILIISIPSTSANTGWWQFSHEDKNIWILLAPSRFTIFPNENIHMLFSVINNTIKTNDPREFYLKDFDVQIKIDDLNAGITVFENNEIHSSDGFIELDYSFPKESFYELNLLVTYQNKNYTFNFPVGVRSSTSNDNNIWIILSIAISLVAGFVLGKALKSKL